jgi:phosphoribosylformylglycinamidine synthase
VNLGLIPFGKIILPAERNLDFDISDKPAFIANKIGRYQATYVNTRVASLNSSWMNLSNVDDIHTLPVSHGNGCLILSDKMLDNLINNGQIATQYTDINGNPSMDTLINPNGSYMAVEGLFSPDGRILGKMGHIERYNKHVAKNIYGNKCQPVIESGINYFK